MSEKYIVYKTSRPVNSQLPNRSYTIRSRLRSLHWLPDTQRFRQVYCSDNKTRHKVRKYIKIHKKIRLHK